MCKSTEKCCSGSDYIDKPARTLRFHSHLRTVRRHAAVCSALPGQSDSGCGSAGGVEACDEITVPAAVFTILVSIAFKLLSAMGTYEGVIGFLLNLLPVVAPPCHAASVGAEVFHFPTNRLYHDLAAVPARLAAINFRMVANMGADGAGWDAHG